MTRIQTLEGLLGAWRRACHVLRKAYRLQIQKWRYGGGKPIKYVFSHIYRTRGWGSEASASGRGSTLIQASAIRQRLPGLIKEIDAKSLLDAGCGDFNWMREVELDLERYVGVDVVEDVIATDQKVYGAETREFRCLDITTDDLPQVDIIMCRDCLVHYSFSDIEHALRNFKSSESKYLLTTTFPEAPTNSDIVTGQWRPLNLEAAPFNWPEPEKLLREGRDEIDGKYPDKSLGLWRLEDIPNQVTGVGKVPRKTRRG